MGAQLSIGVIVAYAIIALLLVVVVGPDLGGRYSWSLYLLLAVTLLFLVRYLSTRYWMDDTDLHAWRLLGSRKIPLEEIRAIEFASLRDLVPTGGLLGIGAFGWRGRMYSQAVGEFDSIYTEAAKGLLVTAGAYPLYISPKDPERFARELSRRARSYSGPLLKDVGHPESGESPI
jgi:hypothetical protein